MKKRYLYSFLFGIPGFIASAIISFVVFGFSAGFLWLFVFGDNPWPSLIEAVLSILFALVFLTAWIASLAAGYVIGKQLEGNPVSNKKPVLVSIGATMILVFFIVFHQLRVGNIGPKSETVRCSEFCTQKGYSASSMPPRDSGDRSCRCLGNSGIEMIDVLIDSIDAGK